MKKFTISCTAKLRGALGRDEHFISTVIAEKFNDACISLYDKLDHVQIKHVTARPVGSDADAVPSHNEHYKDKHFFDIAVEYQPCNGEQADVLHTPIFGTYDDVFDNYFGVDGCFNLGRGEHDFMVRLISISYTKKAAP